MSKLPEVPQEMQDLIRAKCEHYCEIMKKRYSSISHMFTPPRIVYNVRGAVAGWAHSSRNLIRLNPFFLMNEKTVHDMLDDTVPHECAHIFTHMIHPNADAHGWEWKTIFQLIAPGATFKRTHSYDTFIARPDKVNMEFICNCGKIFNLGPNRQKRALRGELWCLRCKGILKLNVENSI